jgi:hypothetical protein
VKRLVSPARWRLDTWIFTVGLLALVLVLTLQTACGAGAKTCAVVDVAAESCKVIRYLGRDGSVQELTSDDLEQLAAARRAARGASPSTAGTGGGR